MRSKALLNGFFAVGILALVVHGCGGSGSSGGPTAPQPPPLTALGSASFQVRGAGSTQSVNYDSLSNTVSCSRNAGWATLFVRFAQQSAGNGGSGPRIDLDLCNHAGGGVFGPMDPKAAVCAGGKTFDIWWHAADGSVFVNTAQAPGCVLMLTQEAQRITGTFECQDLAEEGGLRTVDILNGSFACTVV